MKKIAWKRARTRFAGGMAMALKSGIDMMKSERSRDQRGGTMLQCGRTISRKSFLYGETLWIGV